MNADERDAARYRWLVKNFEFATGPREWKDHHFMFPEDAEFMSECIDAAICAGEGE